VCQDSPTRQTYTLSLHDALPISNQEEAAHAHDQQQRDRANDEQRREWIAFFLRWRYGQRGRDRRRAGGRQWRRGDNVERQLFVRSEEHTSELQSLAYLVCRLLLE